MLNIFEKNMVEPHNTEIDNKSSKYDQKSSDQLSYPVNPKHDLN